MNKELETTEREIYIEENYLPVKPLADRVIVFPEEAESVTTSGIIIPDTAKEKPLRGVVVAIGEQSKIGDHVKQTELKMGDLVLYNKFAGTEVTLLGDPNTYLIMREADILLILAHKGQEDCSEPDGMNNDSL